MNVIIKIKGHEAIPVRAIPLLTDWKTVTPDILAEALSGDDHFIYFAAMKAYRVFNGYAVERRWWENYGSEPLQALGDEIRATETTHKTGKEQWKHESLKKLPAGVYVWRDEFALAHQRHYGRPNLPLDFEGKDVQLTDAESAKLTAEHQERIALNFSPFITQEIQTLVMEGFPSGAEPNAAPAQSPAKPAPATVDQTPDPERRLALLRALGGDAKYARCEWKFKGMAALVTEEKANGRKRCDEKTIRADLKEAAQAERDAKNAGFTTGLGQR